MSICKSMLTELNRYGEDITVTTESGSFVVKGILQPLLYKNKMYIGSSHIPDGYFDTGHYLLICVPEPKIPVAGTAFLESKGKSVVLKRSETVAIKSEALYVWAVVAPYREPQEEDVL